MKSSRTTKSTRRSSTSKTSDNAAKKSANDKGPSPSKRHREKLNTVMNELCELLPLPDDVKTGLDRLSILKLTVSFFHTQNLMITDTSSNACKQQSNSEEQVTMTVDGVNLSELALKAIGGFFLVMTHDGIVYYVSENVKNYLGYPQTRLMHQEFFPIVNPDDVQGLKSCFEKSKSSYGTSNTDISTGGRQECFCNIKCHAGRLSSHVSPFYYKCFKFYGRVKTVTNRSTGEMKQGFFALCSPVSRQINVCRPLSNNVEKYTCKMNAAMSNLEVDSRGLKLLSLSEKDLSGRSSYCFFHPEDLPGMALAHERLLLGLKVCISFRVLKGNGKWQWVRGHADVLLTNGKVDGMVSKNFFVSDEEGKYFKEQDNKDLLEWKAKRALPSPCGDSPSSGCSQSSGNMSPINEMSFHPVQGAAFPSYELPSSETNLSPSSISSSNSHDAPPEPNLPNKKVKSSCLLNQSAPSFKDLPDIDSGTMLRIIKDLQNSLLNDNNGKLGGHFQEKFDGHFQEKFDDHFQEKLDGDFLEKLDGHFPPDVDMMTVQNVEDCLPLLENSLENYPTTAKPFFRDGSKQTNRKDFTNQTPGPFYCIPQNGTHGIPHSSNSFPHCNENFVFPEQNNRTEQHCVDNREVSHNNENSLFDFIPLPFVEVENILSNDESTYSTTSSNMSSTSSLSTEPMDMSQRFHQANSCHGNQPMQCFGGDYNVSSTVPYQGLQPDMGETAVTSYSSIVGSFNHNTHTGQ